MPTNRIATISRVVATGRRINRRDGFMACTYGTLDRPVGNGWAWSF